jgi:hypothetical protein
MTDNSNPVEKEPEPQVVKEVVDPEKVAPKKGTKYIDHLKEDPHILGQKWVCMSFLSPEGIKNCKMRGIKVRGVYPTHKEAKERAKEIRKFDPDFHVFVGEVGKWLPQDPDPNSCKTQEYQEKELNDLMKSYKDNQEKARLMHQERVEEMKRDAMEKKKKQEVKNRLQQQLEEKREAKNAEQAEKDQEKKETPYVDPTDDEANISTLGKEKVESRDEKDVKDIERKLRAAVEDDFDKVEPKKIAGKSKVIRNKRFKKKKVAKDSVPTKVSDIDAELKQLEEQEKLMREQRKKLTQMQMQHKSAETANSSA